MLTKLNTLREEHEDGFTLIELLVVILIIGILAAIAIPVFLNQRKTANDGAVESDVKNATSQIETWIVGQKGKDTPLAGDSAATPPIAAMPTTDIKVSEGVTLTIYGTANDYTVCGEHENGKNYTAAATSLLYKSGDGGLQSAAAACDAPTNAITVE